LKYVDPTGHYGFPPIDPLGLLNSISIIGGMLGSVVESTMQIIGGIITGILNPSPEPDTSVSLEDIAGGYFEPVSLSDLENTLENSGIILSGDEDQYDDFVEGLDPIDDTAPHRQHATKKNIPFSEYQGPAVKDELAYRLNSLDDPSINLFYDTRTGNWNIEQYGDVIGFNIHKVTTWLNSNYNFGRDRWIPFPILPLPGGN